MKTRLVLVLFLAVVIAVICLRRATPTSRTGPISTPTLTDTAVPLVQPINAPSAERQQTTNYAKLLHKWLGTRHFNDTNASAAKAIVASRLLENPTVVAFVRSNFLATARRKIKAAQSPPLWGLENRELPPEARIQVSANIATGFRAALTFPDLASGQGRIFVEVEGGTDPCIKRLENSASTESAVMLDNRGNVGQIAGWSWTTAVNSWDLNQASVWARSAFNDFGTAMDGTEFTVNVRPSTYAAPTDGDLYPALNKKSARFPFTAFKVSLASNTNRLVCEGTLAQTSAGQYRLVEYYGYSDVGNPLGDLADKFLNTPGSDAWAQEIVTQAQSDPQYWLMRAMQLIAVQPPSAP
jgi:hypothetical protein